MYVEGGCPDRVMQVLMGAAYVELLDRSTAVAARLIDSGIPFNDTQEEKIVSLLCPTGLDFLLAWIALMRMGYGVVFVA